MVTGTLQPVEGITAHRDRKRKEEGRVHIQLQLCLPRESRLVPMLRSTAAQFLDGIGVAPEDVEDVELVLAEACANVVRHAVDSIDYSVDVRVNDVGCTISVQDEGPGFDPDDLERARANAEGGRGLQLISALVDDVTFSTEDGHHVVRIRMSWGAGQGPEGIATGARNGIG